MSYKYVISKLIFSVVISFSALAEANILIVSPEAKATQNTSLKSYREWKNSKISEIEGRIKILREKLQSPQRAMSNAAKTQTEAGVNPEIADMLDEEMLNLSNTHDLTIADYFVGYLTKQSSLNAAIREVSGRLTPEEVAELMTAYAEQFSQQLNGNNKASP